MILESVSRHSTTSHARYRRICGSVVLHVRIPPSCSILKIPSCDVMNGHIQSVRVIELRAEPDLDRTNGEEPAPEVVGVSGLVQRMIGRFSDTPERVTPPRGGGSNGSYSGLFSGGQFIFDVFTKKQCVRYPQK